MLCRRSLLKAPKIKLNNLHIASDKKTEVDFLSVLNAHGQSKETFITHQFVHFSPWQKTKKRPRALLPFEVASIPFDIMFSVCFLLFLSLHPEFFFFCLICHQNHRRGGHEQQTKQSKANESFVTTRAPRDSNARHFLNT